MASAYPMVSAMKKGTVNVVSKTYTSVTTIEERRENSRTP